MKIRHILAVFSAGICLSALPVLAEGSHWVTSDNARLMKSPSASSELIKVVPLGAEVKILSSEKSWYQVQIPSGQKGWIYRGRLSDTPPEKASEGESGDLFGKLAGSDIKADEATTGRSIRGLSEETEEYAKNRKTPQATRQALDQVLALRVSENELQDFLKKGKIGEYAPY